MQDLRIKYWQNSQRSHAQGICNLVGSLNNDHLFQPNTNCIYFMLSAMKDSYLVLWEPSIWENELWWLKSLKIGCYNNHHFPWVLIFSVNLIRICPSIHVITIFMILTIYIKYYLKTLFYKLKGKFIAMLGVAIHKLHRHLTGMHHWLGPRCA